MDESEAENTEIDGAQRTLEEFSAPRSDTEDDPDSDLGLEITNPDKMDDAQVDALVRAVTQNTESISKLLDLIQADASETSEDGEQVDDAQDGTEPRGFY